MKKTPHIFQRMTAIRALSEHSVRMAMHFFVMHQSIPAVPIPPPPRATAGHLLTLSVPGVGHSQFYRSPGGWALAYPGATSLHLTHVFSK